MDQHLAMLWGKLTRSIAPSVPGHYPARKWRTCL